MRLRFVALCIFLPFLSYCQVSPVNWGIRAELANDNYTLIIDATIKDGWYIYMSDEPASGLQLPAISVTSDNCTIGPAIFNQKQVITQKDPLFERRPIKKIAGNLHFEQSLRFEGYIPAVIEVRLAAFAGSKDEFLPVSEIKTVALPGGDNRIFQLKLSAINLEHPLADCGNKQISGNHSVGFIFLLGMLGGLIALMTPCVFPMIPVTVSYFSHRSSGRRKAVANGLVYAIFIVVIYGLASFPFHFAGNISPETLNKISTGSGLNIAFFIIFLLFALSFFGAFEITLPSFMANASGAQGGSFFMALTLVIVSFSCTGPILGSLLVGSLADGNGAWQLTAGMLGFGLALGIPFGLFAIFPQWLKQLPKSGSWMETVKKVLAFVELALAFKFLSNADLVAHWGILKREVFIGIWILIALGLSIYLFSTILIDKKKNVYTIPVARKNFTGTIIVAFTSFFFAAYLSLGLTNTSYANLSLISGFAPPLSYSIYQNDPTTHTSKPTTNTPHPAPANPHLTPDIINDYEAALKLSKERNKPLLIDFTGWACVNCRKMEEQIWTKPGVQEYIRNNYILLSLYVDDREKLPAEKQFMYKDREGVQKNIQTLGDKWATFQAENFHYVSQPLYVLLSPDEKLLNHPVGYTPDEKEYQQWLDCGNKAFAKSKVLAVQNSRQ